jgi:alcohol dehydrogenase
MARFRAYKLEEVDKKIRAGFVECSLDDLDPGEVVVRVAYSDVNYKDALAATGKGRILLRPACIGGIDLAGTVTESSDARFAKGDAVLATSYDIGVKHHGGYAQYARLPADWVVKMPPGMTLGGEWPSAPGPPLALELCAWSRSA